MRCFKILVGPAEKGPALGYLERNLGMRKSFRSITGSTYCPRRPSKLMRLRQHHWNVCPLKEAEHGKIIPMMPCMSQMCHLEQKTWVKNNKEWHGIYLCGLLANDPAAMMDTSPEWRNDRKILLPFGLYRVPANWVLTFGLRKVSDKFLFNFFCSTWIKILKKNWTIKKNKVILLNVPGFCDLYHLPISSEIFAILFAITTVSATADFLNAGFSLPSHL